LTRATSPPPAPAGAPLASAMFLFVFLPPFFRLSSFFVVRLVYFIFLSL
jgi:hypothetical protein